MPYESPWDLMIEGIAGTVDGPFESPGDTGGTIPGGSGPYDGPAQAMVSIPGFSWALSDNTVLYMDWEGANNTEIGTCKATGLLFTFPDLGMSHQTAVPSPVGGAYMKSGVATAIRSAVYSTTGEYLEWHRKMVPTVVYPYSTWWMFGRFRRGQDAAWQTLFARRNRLTTYPGWHLLIGDVPYCLRFQMWDGVGNERIVISDQPMPLNEWISFLVTYESNGISERWRLFHQTTESLNGSMILWDESEYVGGLVADMAPGPGEVMLFGCRDYNFPTSSSPWNAQWDEFRVEANNGLPPVVHRGFGIGIEYVEPPVFPFYTY